MGEIGGFVKGSLIGVLLGARLASMWSDRRVLELALQVQELESMLAEERLAHKSADAAPATQASYAIALEEWEAFQKQLADERARVESLQQELSAVSQLLDQARKDRGTFEQELRKAQEQLTRLQRSPGEAA